MSQVTHIPLLLELAKTFAIVLSVKDILLVVFDLKALVYDLGHVSKFIYNA